MTTKKTDLSVGEAMALAIYHLKYVLGEGQAGVSDRADRQSVVEHLDDAVMFAQQALTIYRANTGQGAK